MLQHWLISVRGSPAHCAVGGTEALSGCWRGFVSPAADQASACNAGSHYGLAGQRFETPEAAWDASWKEGQRLVKLYQTELQVRSTVTHSYGVLSILSL